MRPTASTADLYKVARRRFGHLRTLIPTAPVPVTQDVDRATAFVAIELLNLWAQFSRSLYLASCRGARGQGGVRISTTVPYVDDNESLRLATNHVRGRTMAAGAKITSRDEPNWFDPNTLLRALDHVGASNHGAVGAALSLQGRVLRDLPSVRNFYGHRAANTAAKVVGTRGVIQHYAVSRAAHPTVFCLDYEVGRPRPVLGVWLEDINILANYSAS